MHTCKAVAVHCIDFRIQKAVSEYLEQRFPCDYDRISFAGGVKHLLNDGEKNTELEDFLVSNQLHSPKTILLIQHEDCGAYGGSKSFSSFEEEEKFQREQTDTAESLLREHFLDMKIEKLLIRLSGEVLSLVAGRVSV